MHKLCTIDKSSEENKTEENKGALKTWFGLQETTTTSRRPQLSDGRQGGFPEGCS